MVNFHFKTSPGKTETDQTKEGFQSIFKFITLDRFLTIKKLILLHFDFYLHFKSKCS